jgi:hypothetical protein
LPLVAIDAQVKPAHDAEDAAASAALHAGLKVL